jgi:hypothetical protein
MKQLIYYTHGNQESSNIYLIRYHTKNSEKNFAFRQIFGVC